MTTRLETLSPRLAKIKRYVSKRRVADIGCDHGKLIDDLFASGLIDYAFVSDISEPSVQKAVVLLTKHGYNFDYAVADGLQAIKPEHNIEEVVISGMGGLEIIKILSNNTTNISDFVLQPQNNEIALKKFLVSHGYNIIKDQIVKDRHMFYNVLKVIKTNKKQHISAFYLQFGVTNFESKSHDFLEYLDFLDKRCNNIITKAPFFKRLAVKKQLKQIKKAYKKWGKINERNFAISKNWYGT